MCIEQLPDNTDQFIDFETNISNIDNIIKCKNAINILIKYPLYRLYLSKKTNFIKPHKYYTNITLNIMYQTNVYAGTEIRKYMNHIDYLENRRQKIICCICMLEIIIRNTFLLEVNTDFKNTVIEKYLHEFFKYKDIFNEIYAEFGVQMTDPYQYICSMLKKF